MQTNEAWINPYAISLSGQILLLSILIIAIINCIIISVNL
ncbi:Uncharacterised protein [Vibrio cholerae]|nr:Uncharacterised protein [Vibrio cholerae]